jgi:monoamine oxidase
MMRASHGQGEALERETGMTRRDALALLGRGAGASALYGAMSTLGFAAESDYRGPPKLEGAPKGASVLVLGAGIAGLVAAYELRAAGYRVRILEYNARAGGRCWTLRGGDTYTELGGATQRCEFDTGLYLNPGPWRLPYHHHGILDYCHRLGVALEPFVQVNHNAYFHSPTAYGGKPRRVREVQADFHGHVADLLAKAVNRDALDRSLTREDAEKLTEALASWGGLDRDGRYRKSFASSARRGFDVDPAGGLMREPELSTPEAMRALVDSGLWKFLRVGAEYEFQTTIFQPVGGMDRIAQAFQQRLGDVIRYDAKVTEIRQDAKGVSVAYVDRARGGTPRTERADHCVCTIPLSVLAQIPINVNPAMQAAIEGVPYESSVKVGLQFRRRFWEQDERIYGGITYTDLPIDRIGYPNCDYGKPGRGVLLGAYMFGPAAYEFTAMAPQERVRRVLEQGAQVHPQYPSEFENGIAVAWHRVPWTLGCFGNWSDAARRERYRDLCGIDGRIVLAGEHASNLPGWQEGAVLSAIDAVQRLHRRVVAA